MNGRYHTMVYTYMTNVKGIVEDGLKVGPRDLYGPGVYSIEMVGNIYAQEFDYKGTKYKIALQNRVNPAKPNNLKIVDKKDTQAGADYWISPLQDPNKGIYDVRPYGILIRQV